MRSVNAAGSTSLQDLTLRAQIRDRAVECFGAGGLQATTIRTIAGAAGVSPALVIHHYGSKQGLEQACDEHLERLLRAATREALDDLSAGAVLERLAVEPATTPVIPYLIRRIVEGGPAAERIFALLVDGTEQYLATATAAGVVRPAQDDHARAQVLTTISMGTLVLARYLVPGANRAPAELLEIRTRFAEPVLELYTHGLFATDEYLRAFAAHRAAGTAPTPHDPTPKGAAS